MPLTSTSEESLLPYVLDYPLTWAQNFDYYIEEEADEANEADEDVAPEHQSPQQREEASPSDVRQPEINVGDARRDARIDANTDATTDAPRGTPRDHFFIDLMREVLDSVANLERSLGSKIDALDQKVDALDQKVDALIVQRRERSSPKGDSVSARHQSMRGGDWDVLGMETGQNPEACVETHNEDQVEMGTIQSPERTLTEDPVEAEQAAQRGDNVEEEQAVDNSESEESSNQGGFRVKRTRKELESGNVLETGVKRQRKQSAYVRTPYTKDL